MGVVGGGGGWRWGAVGAVGGGGWWWWTVGGRGWRWVVVGGGGGGGMVGAEVQGWADPSLRLATKPLLLSLSCSSLRPVCFSFYASQPPALWTLL